MAGRGKRVIGAIPFTLRIRDYRYGAITEGNIPAPERRSRDISPEVLTALRIG
jgi:hypothetical protein